MGKFTDRQKADSAERELRMRQRVYPRWVQVGRMKEANAEREIAIMTEIMEEYEAKAEAEEAAGRLL